MENISRDNLIDQLYWILGEIKRRPKEAYFILPEIAIAQIDEDWMRQIKASTIARADKLKKDQEKLRNKKDNI